MTYCLRWHGQTGGPQAISGPRPLATRPMKLFANLLLVTASLFVFFPVKDFEKKKIFISLLFYIKVPHMLLTSKTYHKIYVFKVKIVSDTSCCRSKFKTLFNSIVTCAHFSKIFYLSIYYDNLSFMNKHY
jgi:hypothetical protein